MNEKDWLERLKQEGEQIPVPEALSPEAVRKALEKKGEKPLEQKQGAAAHGSEAVLAARKPFRWKRMAAAAAALMLVCGGIGIGMGVGRDKETPVEKPVLAASEEQKGDYGQIYDLLKELSTESSELICMKDTVDIAADTAGMESAKQALGSTQNRSAESSVSDEAGTLQGDFSGTNLQTSGVDEGDIVKTDGDCIYTLDQNYNTITIVQAKGKAMKKLSVISLPEDFFASEFYAAGDRISVLGGFPGEENEPEKTVTYTYDISDRENPQKVGTVSQSGSFSSSRMQGDCLYIFSSFYPSLPDDKAKTEEYIPQAGGKLLDLPGIVVPKDPESPGYLVMAAIDLNRPDRTSDRKAVLSSAETFYVSQENIYAAAVSGQEGRNTQIRKFSYQDGKIEYTARGSVKGYLESSFSMDEYKGYLRLVTTLNTVSGGSYNNVYVLGEDMKVTGSILKLAKDERIYSARFMGDEGYFVTFRETDPLFSVDFSNPEDPKILGQLKIPGFSEYLHFYGSDRLLGVGMEANEKGETSGIKLSMFDLRDPKNVKEEKKYVLRTAYDAEVLTNHHAILIDPEKNLFGFAVTEEDSAKYYLFRYDEKKGFQRLFKKNIGSSGYGIRGLYIGGTFYLVQDNEIIAYDRKTFKKLARLSI